MTEDGRDSDSRETGRTLEQEIRKGGVGHNQVVSGAYVVQQPDGSLTAKPTPAPEQSPGAGTQDGGPSSGDKPAA